MPEVRPLFSVGAPPSFSEETGSSSQDRIEAALRQLRDSCPDNERTQTLRNRLLNWSALSGPDGVLLLREVQEHIRIQTRMKDSAQFLRGVAMMRPQTGVITMVSTVVLFTAVAAVCPRISDVFGHLFNAFIGAILGVCVGYWVKKIVDRQAHRSWFKYTLIPRADASGVELTVVSALLGGIARSTDGSLRDLRVVASYSDEFADVAREMGRPLTPAPVSRYA